VAAAAGRRQRARAPQDALDAREQLARAERLRQVVVGAHLQADDAVDFLGARGEHDDRQARAGAQVAAQREAAVAGQHEVEHHDVGRAAFEHAPHLAPVGRERDAKTVALQVLAEQLADLGVVVDDQDVIGSLHRRASSAPGRVTRQACNTV